MISLALLEASMRYREGYFREDIDAYAAHLESMREGNMKDTKEKVESQKGRLNVKAFNKNFDKKASHLHIEYKNKQEAFNRTAYKKIEEIVGMMPGGFQTRFDNYVTGFGMLAEEFLKAKNTTQLLTVCKLYNQGAMDSIFADIEKKRAEEDVPHIVTESDPNQLGGQNSPM